MTQLPAGVDPRLPVIVGSAQLLHEDGDAPEPVALMIEAARLAEADSVAPGLLCSADTIAVAPVVSWRYHDPARLIAASLGAAPRARWYPAMGGNAPQLLVNRAARAVTEGASDVTLICGAESFRTRQRLRRAGTRPDWTSQSNSELPTWGDAQKLDIGHPAELARGIALPTQCYPLFENALRHASGRTAAEHTAEISELWARFSAVAATNPFAVDRTAHSAEDIATPTPSNRMIGFPYTKHMVANPDLDAASALIVCAAEIAADAGVPPERWSFIWSGADGTDPYLSERADFERSAAIGVAGSAALELAGIDVDDVDHFDVYSCFPSAVQIACAELGIDLQRQLTVTGGLCFAGGPWSNPVGHSLAAMCRVLRDDPGSIGLVTANGGNLQKHAFGIYSSEPPPSGGFRSSTPQETIDARDPRRSVELEHRGPVTVEAWTVMHERDGSMARAHAATLTAEGSRVWGVTSDADTMALMERDDVAGLAATIGADGELRLD